MNKNVDVGFIVIYKKNFAAVQSWYHVESSSPKINDSGVPTLVTIGENIS